MKWRILPHNSFPRRHDLDALRAFAMFLGIVLHAGLSFAPGIWMVQDSQQNGRGGDSAEHFVGSLSNWSYCVRGTV